jgi:hypothetical protein
MSQKSFSKKSLSEQVNEVRESMMSKDEKCKALIKLGFTPYECEFVLRDSGGKFTFTFGVEIECLMMRSRFIEKARANGVRYEYQNYNHADNRSYYKFVSDSSIRGENPIECVSPVLEGNDNGFESLKNCCKTLNEADARVNRSTGLHVHIGVNGMSDKWFVSIFKNYQKLEGIIDTFMAPSRRCDNNTFCRSISGFNFESGINTIADVQRRLSSRYFKVNPMSINRHGTIEFRQHQGTTDFEKISHWVRFCAKLVEWSAKNTLTGAVSSIDEIPFLKESEKAFFKSRAEALR